MIELASWRISHSRQRKGITVRHFLKNKFQKLKSLLNLAALARFSDYQALIANQLLSNNISKARKEDTLPITIGEQKVNLTHYRWHHLTVTENDEVDLYCGFNDTTFERQPKRRNQKQEAFATTSKMSYLQSSFSITCFLARESTHGGQQWSFPSAWMWSFNDTALALNLPYILSIGQTQIEHSGIYSCNILDDGRKTIGTIIKLLH